MQLLVGSTAQFVCRQAPQFQHLETRELFFLRFVVHEPPHARLELPHGRGKVVCESTFRFRNPARQRVKGST